jgi:1-deoxy-D-xylulose-5-phosphate synthase
MRFLKPLDDNILEEVATHFKKIITIEDGVRNGGLGSAILEWMDDHHFSPEIIRMGLPDKFVEHGTVDQLHQLVGIDKDNIKREILR